MRTKEEAMADSSAKSEPLREELRMAIQALSTAVQALTQATQVLLTTSNRMIQAVQATGSSGAPVAGLPVGAAVAAQINVWEDDPFSEAVATTNPPLSVTVTENVPAAAPQNLRWQITEPRPAPALYAPGTPEFRFWNAEAAIARGVTFWAAATPQGTRWTTFAPVLPVTLGAGQRLNARYRRIDGLQFFEQVVGGVTVASGDSPDVVCHELGHAVLDAIKPELFDASSVEVDAFHEAFGDITAMLVALQVPSLRQKVLSETQGRLNVSSRLSRVAEQLGWGIRQRSRDAVDRDSLRNASNRFFYRSPSTLPPEAPASLLSTEPHSFARVFTGSFLDALAGMVATNGAATDAALESISRDMRQLLVDGILTATITDEYFTQVAAAMVQAARVRNNGRYRSALLQAFVERGILALGAVANLERAAVPTLQSTAALAAPRERSMTAFADFPAAEGSGSPTVLAYGASMTRGFERDANTAPELPLISVSAEFVDGPILLHAPVEQPSFSVVPASRGMQIAGVATDGASAAKRFLEDLIHRGRLDAGPATGVVAALSATSSGRDNYTHKLERTDQGLVLKRLHFNCGFCHCEHQHRR
jgi:hypothetical protein